MSGHIEIQGLSKRFGLQMAVDDVSFTCPAGRVTGYLGPNGSGKTTTLRMAVGLSVADRGEVRFGGHRYADLTTPTREVGVVLDPTNLPGMVTGERLLRQRADFLGEPKARVAEMIEWVGLHGQARKRVKAFSLGMRQRLSIGLALMGEPEFFILDEPVNGLDPAGIAWLRGLLVDHAHNGGTVLVSSHLISEMQQMIDHVVVLDRGRVLREVDMSELETGGGPVTELVAEDMGYAESVLAAAGLQVDNRGRHLLVQAAPLTVGQLAAEHRIVIVQMGQHQSTTLEDFFFATVNAAEVSR